MMTKKRRQEPNDIKFDDLYDRLFNGQGDVWQNRQEKGITTRPASVIALALVLQGIHGVAFGQERPIDRSFTRIETFRGKTVDEWAQVIRNSSDAREVSEATGARGWFGAEAEFLIPEFFEAHDAEDSMAPVKHATWFLNAVIPNANTFVAATAAKLHNPAEREEAFELLQRASPGPALKLAMPDLQRRLESSDDLDEQRRVVGLLFQIGPTESSVLEDVFRGESKELMAWALELLADPRVDPSVALPYLSSLIGDTDLGPPALIVSELRASDIFRNRSIALTVSLFRVGMRTANVFRVSSILSSSM